MEYASKIEERWEKCNEQPEPESKVDRVQTDQQVKTDKKTVFKLRLYVDQISEERQIKKHWGMVDTPQPGWFHEDKIVTGKAVQAEQDQGVGESRLFRWWKRCRQEPEKSSGKAYYTKYKEG